MLINKTGDIFETRQPALGHGVNTHGLMGAGIAVAFRRKFPEIFVPYETACHTGALTAGGVLPIQTKTGQWVFNIASQDRPGKHARLSWLKEGMEATLHFCKEENISGIAIPRIGAGIGGLKWEEVYETLEELAEQYDPVDVEIWSL